MRQALHYSWYGTTFWFKMGLVVWGLILAYAALPTTNYIHVHSVAVTNWYQSTFDPENRVLIVHRSLYKNFQGGWRVEEQRKVAFNGWLPVGACANNKPVPYEVTKELPSPLLVGWWTYGRCDLIKTLEPEPGAILRLCTIHYITPLWFLPMIIKASAPVCSNEYKGRVLL